MKVPINYPLAEVVGVSMAYKLDQQAMATQKRLSDDMVKKRVVQDGILFKKHRLPNKP